MPDEEGYVSMPLLTLGQAAAYLGVGRKVVYRLIESGQLRAVKVQGAARLEKSGLDRFKANGLLT